MSEEEPTLSVQKKAEHLFGAFPYELKPTQDYLFTLYRFYDAEQQLLSNFESMSINDIKNIGDMIGFQNFHMSKQSKVFVKDWMKNRFEVSEKQFLEEFERWKSENHKDSQSSQEIEKIKKESVSEIMEKTPEIPDESTLVQKIKNIFDNYIELKSLPEECIEEPPHPVRFLQHRAECHEQIKNLKKSLKKSNHPLASSFKDSIYGSYLFSLEDSFPVGLRNPYLNLCVIYAFENKI
jgi:hypothetical protein